MGWLLTVLFVVLVAAYALVMFILYFLAGIQDVSSLRRTAAFLLILAVVSFGVLIFFASGAISFSDEEEAEPELLPEDEAPPEPEYGTVVKPEHPSAEGQEEVEPPAENVCPNCSQVNPERAKFCFECGTPLTQS